MNMLKRFGLAAYGFLIGVVDGKDNVDLEIGVTLKNNLVTFKS